MKYSLIKPFPGLRPKKMYADKVIAPPYDVIDRKAARILAEGNFLSFLHISKPEIDLSDEIDAYDKRVYQKGVENFKQLQNNQIFEQDKTPCYYLYQLQSGDHVQTGIVTLASVEAYKAGRIARHELTLPVKEEDRVQNILALKAQTSPVLAVFRKKAVLTELMQHYLQQEPLFALPDHQHVIHRFWIIEKTDHIDTITQTFDAMATVYIADGHHRSAASARVSDLLNSPSADYFLTVFFPDDELKILGYHRLVNDITPHDPPALVAALEKTFEMKLLSVAALPERRSQFSLYLAGKWYLLTPKKEMAPKDAVSDLAVSLLSDQILKPLFGISDPRRDPRMQFVGGVDALRELARLVDQSAKPAAAFVVYPTQVSELLTVADNQGLMPPKSTWFEPKLADGLVSYLF
ncbi:MAG: hypothetical protein K0R12_1340 [Gammaproteobacteria bacterium]|jgi:uncharacterized protein (DUF1015 family)|nr:hypothetical protein [Gammaproteobacteria bacterium]